MLQRIKSWREAPFGALVRHFASRVVQAPDSADSGLELGASALLAILALPGAFFSLFLFDKYSGLLRWMRQTKNFDPLSASIPDKFFLVAFAMTVVGVVTVLRWGRILPDRQDYLNLAPLPIHPRTIFFANLLAVAAVVLLFALDVNLAASFLFPLIVSADGGTPLFFVRFVGAHLVSMIAASVFTFSACFGILGLAMLVTPARWFRAVSLWIRGGLLAALAAMMVSGFAGQQIMRAARANPDGSIAQLPVVWFVSLYQSLQTDPGAAMKHFAGIAWWSTAAALAFSLIIYALGYRRNYLLVAESAGEAVTAADRSSLARAGIDAIFGSSGTQRAAGMFALRVLARSETHSMILCAALGMGVVAASIPGLIAIEVHSKPDSASVGAAALSIPLVLLYSILTAARLAFEIPAELRANWMFQIAPPALEFRAAGVARLVLWILAAPVLLLTLAAYSILFSPLVGFIHCAWSAAVSAALIELLLIGYRKIACTCSIPQPRNHAVLYVFGYLAGFGIFAGAMSKVAAAFFVDPARWAIVPLFAVPLLFWWRGVLKQTGQFESPLTFEESEIRAVQTLNLFDRSL